MTTVSIIIPCYNASSYIDNCLTRILKDELENKEIILVNDGSKDNTLTILKKYQKKYKEITVIDQVNSGQAIARNKALKKATGKYIMFVDIDDYICDNAIKIMYDYAEENKCDYVFSDYYEHYKEMDKIISNYFNEDIKKNAIVANFAPWAKLIARDLIDKINFSFCEGKIFEDIAVIPHLAASSENPGYISKPLYYYNMANVSTTRDKVYQKKFEDIIFVSDYLYEKLKKDELLEKYEEEIKYIYLDGILKSGVLKFAKYKEGIKNIKVLRKNVKKKFNKLFINKYFKNETFYRKFTAWSSVYLPANILYLMKKIKG